MGPAPTNKDLDSRSRTSSAGVRSSLPVKYVALTHTRVVSDVIALEEKYQVNTIINIKLNTIKEQEKKGGKEKCWRHRINIIIIN